MIFSTRAEDDVKVVTVSGHLDTSSSVEFREKFLEETTADKKVVLDCSSLEYLDSSGLATLVNVFKNVEARGVTLVICGFSGGILRVIQFTQLDKVLALSDSLEEAFIAVRS